MERNITVWLDQVTVHFTVMPHDLVLAVDENTLFSKELTLDWINIVLQIRWQYHRGHGGLCTCLFERCCRYG